MVKRKKETYSQITYLMNFQFVTELPVFYERVQVWAFPSLFSSLFETFLSKKLKCEGVKTS